jgi:hypothetical protein
VLTHAGNRQHALGAEGAVFQPHAEKPRHSTITIRNFDSLLQPRSVALIGVSPRPGSVGIITTRSFLRWRIFGRPTS